MIATVQVLQGGKCLLLSLAWEANVRKCCREASAYSCYWRGRQMPTHTALIRNATLFAGCLVQPADLFSDERLQRTGRAFKAVEETGLDLAAASRSNVLQHSLRVVEVDQPPISGAPTVKSLQQRRQIN